MLDRPVRIGVIGTGNMGKNHARVLATSQFSTLVGCYDVLYDRACAVADAVRTRAFRELEQLLACVEAVVVAVPPAHHYEVAKACIERGIHVLLEKPISRTVEEAEVLERLAEKNGVILQIGHIERFNPAIEQLSGLVSANNIVFVSVERLSPFDGRATDVDVIEDLMIHDLDIITSLVRSPISFISAQGLSVRTARIDHCVAILRFENGVVANIVASRVTENKIRKMRVTQSRTYVELDYMQKTIDIYKCTEIDLVNILGVASYRQENTVQRVSVPYQEPLRAQDDSFCLAVRGEGPNRVPARQGIEALKVVRRIQDAVYTSGLISRAS